MTLCTLYLESHTKDELSPDIQRKEEEEKEKEITDTANK